MLKHALSSNAPSSNLPQATALLSKVYPNMHPSGSIDHAQGNGFYPRLALTKLHEFRSGDSFLSSDSYHSDAPLRASRRWRWTRPRRRAGHRRPGAGCRPRLTRFRSCLRGPSDVVWAGVTSAIATTSPGACAAVGPRPAAEAAFIAAAPAAATG